MRGRKAQDIRGTRLSEVGLAEVLGLLSRDERGPYVPRLLRPDSFAECRDLSNVRDDFSHYLQQGISLHTF